MEWIVSMPVLFFGIKLIKTLVPNMLFIYLFRAAFLHSHKPLKKRFLIQAQVKFAANIYHLKYI